MAFERARRRLERFAGRSGRDHAPESSTDPGATSRQRADRTSAPAPLRPPTSHAVDDVGLLPGLEHSIEFVVSPELQTDIDGTLSNPVLASPRMIGLMERAAVKSVADRLPPDRTTVGFDVLVRHVAAAPAGAACVAHARLREIVDGRKLRFDVEVLCGDRTIGVGTHERRLVRRNAGSSPTGYTGLRMRDVVPLAANDDTRDRLSRPRRIALGVVLPSPGETGLEPGLAEHARMAEDAGADSLWVDDHLVQVESSRSPYPFSRDAKPTWPAAAPRWESLTALAFVAAATERCTIGTAVIILPQRHVVELAKTTATLDVLSGGRLVLGCGVGWLAEEMEACGWSFGTRGARADEMLTALRACWTGRPAAFAGEHVKLADGLLFYPTPLQRPGPPLLVGGMSAAALRRAAQHGDGWLAFVAAEMLDYDELVAQLETVTTLRAESQRADEPFRRSLVFGAWPRDPEELLTRLLELAALGFDELIVEPTWVDAEACAHTIADIRDALSAAR